MFSFGFCLETALGDGESWVGKPGNFSGVSAPVVGFWICMEVILLGKANCWMLHS